ncbi:uncharacterized protein MKK02DRAFT_31876 [Dioszegia hungarica]|uniref:Uncharacterized protein n=1 Tax=Dioszegia hungarica TaxID=4972 RepID=A0AA38HD60_9TREE|nr:uncharacterized protein MKK02DRAFT_31876 [Dioszegia hungarica]KAI9638440.1 hypothetical protein MKK02DRAFT_31876 [Dioszegia hungarica]
MSHTAATSKYGLSTIPYEHPSLAAKAHYMATAHSTDTYKILDSLSMICACYKSAPPHVKAKLRTYIAEHMSLWETLEGHNEGLDKTMSGYVKYRTWLSESVCSQCAGADFMKAIFNQLADETQALRDASKARKTAFTTVEQCFQDWQSVHQQSGRWRDGRCQIDIYEEQPPELDLLDGDRSLFFDFPRAVKILGQCMALASDDRLCDFCQQTASRRGRGRYS